MRQEERAPGGIVALPAPSTKPRLEPGTARARAASTRAGSARATNRRRSRKPPGAEAAAAVTASFQARAPSESGSAVRPAVLAGLVPRWKVAQPRPADRRA